MGLIYKEIHCNKSTSQAVSSAQNSEVLVQEILHTIPKHKAVLF